MKKVNLHQGDFRYEKKSAISELSYGEIENLIQHHPSVFSKIFYERTINNIYLDSVDLENYHDNLAGVSQRIKVRVRWYGKMFGLIKNPVLEIKIRNHELIRKLSFKLQSFFLDKNFSHFDLQKEVFAKSNLPSWLIMKLKLLCPVLLNSYKRKYFLSSDKACRITLDRDLRLLKIKSRQNAFNEKLLDKQTKILEIKFAEDYLDKAAHLINKFPFRITANSKYVFGIDLLDLW